MFIVDKVRSLRFPENTQGKSEAALKIQALKAWLVTILTFLFESMKGTLSVCQPLSYQMFIMLEFPASSCREASTRLQGKGFPLPFLSHLSGALRGSYPCPASHWSHS